MYVYFLVIFISQHLDVHTFACMYVCVCLAVTLATANEPTGTLSSRLIEIYKYLHVYICILEYSNLNSCCLYIYIQYISYDQN